jgi:hypothetical protein
MAMQTGFELYFLYCLVTVKEEEEYFKWYSQTQIEIENAEAILQILVPTFQNIYRAKIWAFKNRKSIAA